MKVRKFNDQMMLLERSFLDPNGHPGHWDRKHIILGKFFEFRNILPAMLFIFRLANMPVQSIFEAPNDDQEHRGGFPGLVDLIAFQDGESLDSPEFRAFVDILKVHYNAVVYTILNAIKVIEEVESI